MNKLLRFVLCAGLALLAPLAVAAPPQTINYQGYLTNPGGTPVNSAVGMTFKLYNVASGGVAIYSETQLSVNVANGIFNTVIGSVTPIPLPFDVPYWLGVQVNADLEMTPRQPLTSSPYAFRASSLDSAATVLGSQVSGAITNAVLPASPSLSGNLTLVDPSTETAGNIMKGANRFIHNYGVQNTFIGELAGNFTMTGSGNTAIGGQALVFNTTGSSNTASGANALFSNTTGIRNTASGENALHSNTTGNFNTASGWWALTNNTTGSGNTASGEEALNNNTTGSNNIALGSGAGLLLTTGSNNIHIGNLGVAAEGSTIRIGTGNQTRAFIAGIFGSTIGGSPVIIGSTGQLGTTTSSRRYKDNIADMDAASSALMQLRPVTFHYKTDQNPAGRTLQYGLIAEEVAEVYPGLVVHSADGQIETVMYQHLPPMLLNEFQKQQRTIMAQATDIQRQSAELARQRARIFELEQQSARVESLERRLLIIEAMLAVRSHGASDRRRESR